MRTCARSRQCFQRLQNGELAAGDMQLEGNYFRVNRAIRRVREEALACVALGDSRLNPAALYAGKQDRSRV